jgi:NitT/TauT family transport system permease protein
MKYRMPRWVIQVCILFAFLGGWEVLGRANPHFSFVAATPIKVIVAFSLLLFRGSFFLHFSITATEAILGLVLGVGGGTILGLLFWYSQRWAEILRPYIVAFSSVPLFALAPLMIVWFGVGFRMKIAMAFFSTVTVALNQALEGALAVSDDHLSILRGLGATRSQMMWKAVIPGAMRWVLNSMRISSGLSLLGAFMGEFISSERGLGYLILRASGLYDVPRALAAAVGIILLALASDSLSRLLEKNSDKIVECVSVPRALRSKRQSNGW